MKWQVSQLGSTQLGALGEDKRRPEAGKAGHFGVLCAPLIMRSLHIVLADPANVTPILQDEETQPCPIPLPLVLVTWLVNGPGGLENGSWVILWCQWPADSLASPDKLSDFRAWVPAAPFLQGMGPLSWFALLCSAAPASGFPAHPP